MESFMIDNDVVQYILITCLALCVAWIGFNLGRVARSVSTVAKSLQTLAEVTAMAVNMASPKITASDWEMYLATLDTPDKFNAEFTSGAFQRKLTEYARSVERHGHA
jgi:hypothetical protein